MREKRRKKRKSSDQEEGTLHWSAHQGDIISTNSNQELLRPSGELVSSKKRVKSNGSAKQKLGLLVSQTLGTISSQLKLRDFIFFQSIVTVAIYITMIEGLGKGVKYSLFVANAIIFVSYSQPGLMQTHH